MGSTSSNGIGRLNGSSSLRQPIILIVDDDDDNLLLLSYALEDLGYFTVQGRSGQEAIDLATRHAPNLILLDVLLPDMNGTVVIRHIRKRLKMRHTPIIAVTALARPVDQAKILAAGFTEYLSKPYMLDELGAAVERYLAPALKHPIKNDADYRNSCRDT
ncbi:MAG: response regulator [Cyanobacteria bacterium P01_A01_bin.15]|mgnify:CR=1 FL=1